MAFKQKEAEEQALKSRLDLLSVPVKTEKERMAVVENLRDELRFLADLVQKQDPSSRLAAAIKERLA